MAFCAAKDKPKNEREWGDGLVLIRTVLFILSTVGFWELIRHRSNVHVSFLPSLTVALQACVLLAGGMVYLLPETAWILEGSGIVSLLYWTVRGKGTNLKEYIRAEYLFLVLGTLILFFCVQGRVVTHFDNFTHWAHVLNKMLKYDHFPDQELGVLFPHYPLGSTAYVYAAVRLTGAQGEPVWMLAQGYMILTCIVPLFAMCGRRSWPAFLLITVSGSFMISYNIQVSELLVDTLLPLAGMCALLLIRLNREKPRAIALWTALYLVWLLQIKNAGIFFALAAGTVYLFYAGKNHQIKYALPAITAGILSLLIWRWHCSVVSPQATGAGHSLSVSWWTAVFRDKSPEDVRYIILALARYACTWRELWLYLISLGMMGVFCLVIRKEYRQAFEKMAGCSLILYLTYQAGLLLMYLFSMVRSEALFLSSADRYEKSVMLGLYYMLTGLGVRMISDRGDGEKKNRDLASVHGKAVACGKTGGRKDALQSFCMTVLLGISFSLTLWKLDLPWSVVDWHPYRIGIYDGLEVRSWMENLKEEYSLPEDGEYAILISDWDSQYFWHMGMYLFPESNITVVGELTEEALEKISAKQVMIYDKENPAVREWVHRNYPEQEGNALIQVH